MEKIKFLEVEKRYNELKAQLEQGLIDSSEVKAGLKKLMLQDENGNYWMIGSNTGKWYIYNGKEWKEEVPYPPSNEDFSTTQQFSHADKDRILSGTDYNQEDKEISIEEESAEEPVTLTSAEETEKENELMATGNKDESSVNEINLNLDGSGSETVIRETGDAFHNIKTSLGETEKETKKDESVEENSRLLTADEDDDNLVKCIVCQSKIPAHAIFCNFCGANQKELGSGKKSGVNIRTLSSFNVLSLIFFLGGLGLIVGVIFGASFGIFNFMGDILQKFPQMLIETRGKIQGGLIFAALGGIGGFIFFSLLGFFSGLIYNLISNLFGGIKIRIK